MRGGTAAGILSGPGVCGTPWGMLLRQYTILALAGGLLLGAMAWPCAGWAAPQKKPPAAGPAGTGASGGGSAAKPDKKQPPMFDMKAYMDAHKAFVQCLATARAFMEQEKNTVPQRAGMANYFLGELDRARLLAENAFDMVFLYFDHFLQADAVSNLLAGYVGNRIRQLSHGMEDLAAELGENMAKSPYAKDPRFAEAYTRLSAYQVQLDELSRRIIPVQ